MIPPAASPKPDSQVIYRPRRAKPLALGTILPLIAVAICWEPMNAIALWLRGGAAPDARTLFMAGLSLMVVVLAAITLTGALRGLPRLTLTRDSVTLESLFAVSRAEWSSLSSFRRWTLRASRFGRHAEAAVSAITGSGASANLIRLGKLTIPDAFRAPFESILADLNLRHSALVGSGAADAALLVDHPRFGIAGFRAPWLTFALIGFLVAIFLFEQRYALAPPGSLLRLSTGALMALGSENWRVITSTGEWYRLFTAPLLHRDVLHLFFNSLALLIAGCLLEGLVGRAWFFAFFAVGALGGSILSLVVNPATINSCGASGAIMALFAAAFICSFRWPPDTKERARAQFRSIYVLVVTLVPPAATVTSTHVDYAAHLGGAICGAALAAFLLETWRETDRLPRFRRLAGGVAIGGAILFAASAAAVAAHYPLYRPLGGLIPEGQLPQRSSLGDGSAAQLVLRYPGDPRAHGYRGAELMAQRDYPAAEAEFRIAESEATEFEYFFGRQLTNSMRAALAAVLLEEGHETAAKDAAAPACLAPPTEAPTATTLQLLADEHLCE